MKREQGMFAFIMVDSGVEVVTASRDCSRDYHIQQVAYSVHHEALTQLCFTCKKICTNMEVEK